MIERPLHVDVKALLESGEPFKYAHLVKFERPSRPDALSGKVSTSAQRYTYLTDASRDVTFDDLSKNLEGGLNGPQVYLANKIMAVSNIQEAVQAKGDSTSITLDGNGLGGSASGTVTITSVNSTTWDVQWPDTVDLVQEGFREGDKITFSGARTGSFNIQLFRANNVLRIRKIDVSLTVGTAAVTMTLDSEEVKSILLNKNDENYASFVNREVFIYRAYFDDSGTLVGSIPDVNGNTGPLLLFRGIINNVAFDDGDDGITVQWGVSSHWGDFSQVRGRITSDEFHRALDANGLPQPESAIKALYAYDKGFAHSDTSLNLLATYTVMVDKTTIKAKNGFFGIGAKTKVKTVAVPEGRTTPLDFQLQAKSIPVIYGVRSAVGIPIFADTLKTNSSEVYVVYALSEGQIGGLYDVYIDGKSLICNNKEDFDFRSKQSTDGSVDIICRGRADRGDVLGGVTSTGGAPLNYYYDPGAGVDLRNVWNHIFNRNALSNFTPYVPPVTTDTVSNIGKGVIHGESIRMTSPQEITLDLFSGTESQKAASLLVGIARANNFKVQNDYWTGGDTSEYWGPNHRLADTAYIVGKFRIKEGETTIPDLEFIVRGKVLDCYNYDYSYTHDDKMTSENQANFLLGDTVTLSTGQTVQIIDKWSFVKPDGTVDYRFRFSQPPDLGYDSNAVPTIKRFTMTKGANVWTMVTFDWVMHSGTVPQALSTPATVVETGTGVTVTYPSTPGISAGGDSTELSPIYSVINDDGTIYRDSLLSGSANDTSLVTQMR